MTQRALITGCSSGIGRALAEELTRRGFDVIATARDPKTLDDLKVAARLPLDVTSDESVAQAVAAAGRIDILINNAGLGMWGPLEAVPLDAAQRLFDANVWGPVRMIKAVAPQMRTRKAGVILQISSAAGQVSVPLLGYYSASKHALEAMSEALRIELAAFGVRVAIIQLGAVTSSFGQNRVIATSPDYREVGEKLTAHLMAKRTVPTTSEDVSVAIADIIAEGATHIRYAATADAVKMIAARRAQSDDQWEEDILREIGVL